MEFGRELVIDCERLQKIDGLIVDFSEHDKVFEDEIELLKNRIAEMEREKEYLRMRCMDDAVDAFDRGMEH